MANDNRLEFIRNWIDSVDGEPRESPDGSAAPLRSPVAVIGMDGVFPQDRDIQSFWSAIESEETLYRSFSPEFLSTRRQAANGVNGERLTGGVLGSALDFDPRFFKISDGEAELMDPQLRLLLMSVYRAIEDAGYTAAELADNRVGVFVGCEGSEYNDANVPGALKGNYLLNHAGCSIAHRVSHCFDFKGPSEVVNTMCSSAAYGICRAVELLRSGEIDIAIVGAVKVNFSPLTYRFLSDMKMTSTETACYSFHEKSWGYIRSEGVVTIVLKPAAKARNDGDHVLARIREVVTNYNGRDGNSMFSPSKNGQRDLIKQCYTRAGVNISDIAYIEAQGMGNEVSDFVEFNAIEEACDALVRESEGEPGTDTSYPVISTMKPILGHMECVSALGALAKIVLTFRTRTIHRIPSLRAENLNKKIDLQNARCKLLLENKTIGGDAPILAAMNSFGASGTNVHILLESGDAADKNQQKTHRLSEAQVLPVSARSHKSLIAYVKKIHRYLTEHGEEGIENLCYTFQVRREHHPHRAIFFVGRGFPKRQSQSLRVKLDNYLKGSARTGFAFDNIDGSRHRLASGSCGSQSSRVDSALLKDAVDWLAGTCVNWRAYRALSGEPRRVCGLPTYPFDTRAYRAGFDSLRAHSQAEEPFSWWVADAGATILQETDHRKEPADDTPVSRAELEARVKSAVIGQLSAALKIDKKDISNDIPFAEYGVDSITGVTFVKNLNRALMIEVETISLFDHSSVNALVKHIVSRWSDKIRRSENMPGSADDIKKAAAARPGIHYTAGSAGTPGNMPVHITQANTGTSVSAKEPIAIIGMSGRFAEAENLDALWEHLKSGSNLVKEVKRWPGEACMGSGSGGRPYCSKGSFIDSIDCFDPLFFNISPLEAQYMDPQQRLFLEESWKALEDAGYVGKAIAGKRCGVFAGCNHADYMDLFDEEPPEQAFWGSAVCVIPARISYYLNLTGPAVMVDTACSSSLVAIHVACQSLWSGESEMALAGGVFLQVTPKFFQYSNRAGMLSPDGRCATFDADANGFAPGEGVGVVVLKPLSCALRDRDPIHGVIRGSGVNQDGKTNGITAPSAKSQEELERSVYNTFNINPEAIQVMEAHGTGTSLGDPIEVSALNRSFRAYTDKKQYCAIGSVKTNIGHTAAAAGIAGTLKLLLALKNRQIPPSLHFHKPNPMIDFKSSPFYVNTELKPWDRNHQQPRTAAVSSFGFSGTNAHIVISEGPETGASVGTLPAYLFVLSARTADQLRQQAENLLGYIKRSPTVSLTNVAYTLFVGRMHMGCRLSCIARDREELIERMEAWLAVGENGYVETSEIEEDKVGEDLSVKNDGNARIAECLAGDSSGKYLENLRAIAGLYLRGYDLNYSALFPPEATRVSLPTYPFSRERHWLGQVPEKQQNASPRAVDAVRVEEIIDQIHSGMIEQAQGVSLLKSLL